MNKLFSTFFVLGLLSFCTLSPACKKDNKGPDAGANGACQISYTLNGKSETSTPVVCIYLDGTLQLGLIGSNSIAIQINDLDGPATLQVPTEDVLIIIDLEDGTRLSMESGSVTVSELSTARASGTFSGTLRDISDVDQNGPTVTLSNGKFNASY